MQIFIVFLIVLIIISIVLRVYRNFKFDLDNLSFPIVKDSLLPEFECQEQSYNNVFTTYQLKNKKPLFFKGLLLSDNKEKEGSIIRTQIKFYEDVKLNIIDAFSITAANTKEILKLEEQLVADFGTRNYHYKEAGFTYNIWQKGNRAYFFKTNISIAFLMVINTSNKKLFKYQLSDELKDYTSFFIENEQEVIKNRSLNQGVLETQLQ